MSPVDHNNELISRYDAACAELTEAAHKGRHPFHLMTAACVNEMGAPELRTVVLRRFDASLRRIVFHTDIRSPKARWLKANSSASLLFYDRESKLQLRFHARAVVHYDDALTQEQWARTSANSKLCYLALKGSGEEAADAEECGMDGRRGEVQPGGEDEEAYGNFAVIACLYDRLDIVQLDYRGHERCELSWEAGEKMHARWLVV